MPRILLPGIPSLGRVYAAALPGILRRVHVIEQASLPARSVRVAHASVSAEEVVAYQRLMADTVRDEVPSVLLHGLGFPVALWLMSRSDFPLPLLGLVHLRQEVEHRSVVRPGEELAIEAMATGLQPHAAGTVVEILTTLSRGDEQVWTGRSTYLAKGVRLRDTPRPEREPHASVPDVPTVARWRLGPGAGRRYAAVMGDYNPIHLSRGSAQLLGLKAPIAHGMHLAGRALASLAPHEQPYHWSITFAAPVYLPGTVEVGREDTLPERPGQAVRTLHGWDARTGRYHFTLCVGPSAA